MSTAPVEANSNDVDIEKRLRFVHKIARDVFGFELSQVKAIAYETGFPFPYNNFVYRIEVSEESLGGDHAPRAVQPGTQPMPDEMQTFMMRLSNPLSGYNENNRIENEVAALSVAREALHTELPHLIPRVFGWGSARGGGHGWMLQELMSGSCLYDDFPEMDDQQQDTILGQMADIFACIQRHPIPNSIEHFGGLTFDSQGQCVSGPVTFMTSGPFNTYGDYVKAMVTSKLAKADADPNVDGWRDKGIRQRLDTFLATHGYALADSVGESRKVLVHGDYSTDNLLYDKASLRITALIDFDFAHIATVADEFFRSLGHGIGRFPEAMESDKELAALHKAMLHGFPEPLPLSNDTVRWRAAKAWNDALRVRGIQRPETIRYISTLSDVFWLSSQILPFKLCNEVVVGNSTREQLLRRKEDGDVQLASFLSSRGF